MPPGFYLVSGKVLKHQLCDTDHDTSISKPDELDARLKTAMDERKLVRVIIQDAGGRLITDARVSIEAGPEPTPDIAALTNEQGEVLMSVPKSGKYSFVCVANSFLISRTVVVVNNSEQSSVTMTLVSES